MIEVYAVKLMDEEDALIFVEQVDETIEAAFNRYIAMLDKFLDALVGQVESWVHKQKAKIK